MDDWAYEMAAAMKAAGKQSLILGPCIGDTISITPFKVAIQNGQYLLDQDNAYVCRQLLGRNSRYETIGQHSQSGTLNGESYTAVGTIEENGDIQLKQVWKIGDKVLVVPSGDGQKFFIVDIVEV